MNYTPKQPAYSLVFAFLVMTVIMIVASATIQNTESKVRYFAELEATAQARLAAESAVERAVAMVRDYGAGYEVSGESEFCVGGSGSCESYGNYEVYADGTLLSDGYYYLPIAGTGTAGLSDDCSVLDVNEDPDDPCNWNKLMYGESVTIPLYSIDSENPEGSILTADDLGIDEWSLRVRTPCVEGYDADCVRYEFDTSGSTYASGDTIVLWQVIYEDSDTGSLAALVPDDVMLGPIRHTTANTEVYEEKINTANVSGDYVVLSSDDIADYAANDVNELEAVLQLDIVSPLRSAAGTIPYLEWQLQMGNMATAPFADGKSVFVGECYHEVNGKIYYFPYVVTRSTVGEGSTVYTLSN